MKDLADLLVQPYGHVAPAPESQAATLAENPTAATPPKKIHPNFEKLKEWRKKNKVIEENRTFGEKFVRRIDPNLNTLTHEQHLKLLALENDEQVSALLAADLSDTLLPNITGANTNFGWMLKNEELPSMVCTLRFYTIAQNMRAMASAQRLADKQNSTKEERLSAIRLVKRLNLDINIALTRVESMMNRLNPKPKLEEAQEPEPEQKNNTSELPPDLDGD